MRTSRKMRKRPKSNIPKPPTPIAKIVLHGVRTMSAARRTRVAAWLHDQADQLVDCYDQLSNTYRAGLYW